MFNEEPYVIVIDIGCDKYFQNDSWYIEHKKEVADNE